VFFFRARDLPARICDQSAVEFLPATMVVKAGNGSLTHPQTGVQIQPVTVFVSRPDM